MTNDSGRSNDAGQSNETDTGQISVAELLARNGQQAPKRDGGRRRGRPGGISVAELTGDLPVFRETDTGSIHAVLAEEPVAEETRAAPAVEAEPQPSAGVAPEFPAPPKRKRPQLEIEKVESEQPQAWSSAEREPELLSGGTVAGDLMRTRTESPQPVAVDPPAARIGQKADAKAAQKAEAKAAKKADREARQAEAEPSAARAWLILGGQAVLAVVAGALLFKGFEQLWVSMQWIALALAVVVIVGLVAVVRILRKTDDLFSLVIAIVVGLFVTLGPLVFVLTTGRG